VSVVLVCCECLLIDCVGFWLFVMKVGVGLVE